MLCPFKLTMASGLFLLSYTIAGISALFFTSLFYFLVLATKLLPYITGQYMRFADKDNTLYPTLSDGATSP